MGFNNPVIILIVVVLPAYNAAKTLEQTYSEIPHNIVDEVVLVDDQSDDNTVDIAKKNRINAMIEGIKRLRELRKDSSVDYRGVLT